MKNYDVYGLGNALVDIEFEVSPDVLQDCGIEKSVMTLIDSDRQQELADRLQPYYRKRSCGGSAANTMIAISQFGGKAFYSCKVAADETGAFYLADLQNCGVDSNSHKDSSGSGVTGKCLVLLTPDADRTMNTFLGITADFSEAELVPEAIVEASYTYIEGYLVTSPTGLNAAIKAREIAQNSGKKVSLSLSDPNMARFFKPGLLEILGTGVDLIFANEGEALDLAESGDLKDAIAYLQTLSKAFAITRGAQGSLVYDGENFLNIDPVVVQAIDTVGAGDMYAGAFLYGLTHGFSYLSAGILASRASAQIVTEFGPRLSTAMVQALLVS
jgi:sugar/nucleoside kinase (ribokinase family)